MNLWTLLMLVSGGLFSGGVAVFAWERVPAWRRMPLTQFRADFATAIGKADRVQPALLVATIAATVGFLLTATGPSRTVALVGAVGFIVTLIGSVAVLVPLQRRIIADSEQRLDLEALRGRWFLGHMGRTVLGVTSFVLVAVAAAV
jgi:membrane associated rhomboid family serine protease